VKRSRPIRRRVSKTVFVKNLQNRAFFARQRRILGACGAFSSELVVAMPLTEIEPGLLTDTEPAWRGWLGVDEQVPLGRLFQMKGLAPVHAHEHLLGKEKGL
jgi:hypothetical protein